MRLLKHWRERVVWSPGQHKAAAPASTAAVLQRLGVLRPYDYCYCKFRFEGGGIAALDTFAKHCAGPAGRAALARWAGAA